MAFFELSALGSDVWLGVRSWKTWSSTEVLLGLSILGCSEQNGVGTGWAGHNKLVEGKALTSSSNDSSSSTLSESKSGNGHLLWGIKKSVVISDGGNNDGDFVLSLKELSNLGDGDWWSVDS